MGEGSEPRIIWQPQPGPQTLLLKCPVYDVFFGGARGGGKTDGMLGDWVEHAQKYGKHARGLILRREYEQVLKFLLPRMRELFIPLGAVWKGEERFWLFPNGAAFYVRHLNQDVDAEAFQGDSYTRVYFEELTNFPSPDPVDKMHAVLRSGHGIPPAFRATGNPGGPGHSWVKYRYIDPWPSGLKVLKVELGDGSIAERVFIPSKLDDNKILVTSDPGYRSRLHMAGSKELVRAWLEGDWDIVAGSALDISKERHLLRPFTPPSHVTKFMAIDWGYVKPFYVAWYCVMDEDTILAAKGDYKEMILPKGSIVQYREIYGTNGKPNEGARRESPLVAQDIMAAEKVNNERMDYRVGDAAMWAKNDGTSIAERMGMEGVKLIPSKKDRMAGYGEFTSRLKGEESAVEGIFNPMFFVTANCINWWRTVPALTLDKHKPESGPDTDQDDHAYDTCQYALMSRPYIRTTSQRIWSEFKRNRRANKIEPSDPYRLKKGWKK